MLRSATFGDTFRPMEIFPIGTRVQTKRHGLTRDALEERITGTVENVLTNGTAVVRCDNPSPDLPRKIVIPMEYLEIFQHFQNFPAHQTRNKHADQGNKTPMHYPQRLLTTHTCPKCGHTFTPDPLGPGTRVALKDTGGTWNGVVVAPDHPEDLKPETRLVEFEHAPGEFGFEPGQRLAVPSKWLTRLD